MSRNLDELVSSTEHAEPVHPVRELLARRFYTEGLVNADGGLWLVLINALLVIPLIMAAFFYPMGVLLGVGICLLLLLAGFGAYLFVSRRRRVTG